MAGILSADISKAFLQGVTYDELVELTGTEPREINFYLPTGDIPLLRKLPGLDPQKEVLHCDKPDTGLADAPRAFQVKLTRILIGQCKMHQSKVDAELCFRHDRGRLVRIMTIHVDDLKIAFATDANNSLTIDLPAVRFEPKQRAASGQGVRTESYEMRAEQTAVAHALTATLINSIASYPGEA